MELKKKSGNEFYQQLLAGRIMPRDHQAEQSETGRSN